MTDDAKVEKVSAEKKHLKKLERELGELRASYDTSRGRVSVLEERMKQQALAATRTRLLQESAERRGVLLEVSRAAGLLEQLTSNVVAEVDETGRVSVPEAEQEKIREQVDAIIETVGAPSKVVSPPIAPGEPPTRTGQTGPDGFANCWDAASKRGGMARGKELISVAAQQLEREGVL